MSWPWASPEATRRGLSDRLARHPPAERSLRLLEVAFRRLLVRLELADPGRWLLKGGVALLVRLDPSRTSDDIDLVYLDEPDAWQAAIAALERAFVVDAGDFIRYRFAAPPVLAADERRETVELDVEALIGERRWLRFAIDLGRPSLGWPSEPLRARGALTGLAAVDDVPGVRALALPQQIAEKTCAIFELHGPQRHASTRPRDLADVALIATQVSGIESGALSDALAREAARRLARGSLAAPLPPQIVLADAQRRDWQRRWAPATRHVALSLDDALAQAAALLDPILDATAVGCWDATTRTWRPDTPDIAR